MFLKIKNSSKEVSNLVLVGNSKTKFSKGVEDSLIKQFHVFLEGEKDVDYFKSTDQFLVFIKGDINQEKNRVSGYNVRKLIDKKESEIFVEGDQEMVLSFCEGFALSSYQFLKYFKNADTKKNRLESIFVSESCSNLLVSELNTTIKSCLLYTSPSPRDRQKSRMPSSA